MIRLVSHTALPTLSPATLRRPMAIAAERPRAASPAISRCTSASRASISEVPLYFQTPGRKSGTPMKFPMPSMTRMLGSAGEVIEVVNMGTSRPTSVTANTARTRSACARSGSTCPPGSTERSQPSKPRSRSTFPSSSYSTFANCLEYRQTGGLVRGFEPPALYCACATARPVPTAAAARSCRLVRFISSSPPLRPAGKRPIRQPRIPTRSRTCDGARSPPVSPGRRTR